MIPPKSQLTQREEDEAKAARDMGKKKTKVSAKPQEPQDIQSRFQLRAKPGVNGSAAAGAKPKRTRGAQADRELEKKQKAAELDALQAMVIPVPLPYKLQLPALPQRQNHTGRNLKLKLMTPDPTFPRTPAAREYYVAILVDAIRDCRIAQDKVALTTNYWYVWLKPVLEGRYAYEELDMERVCRKLVNIAEALHIHGLGATDIYCPETIRKAMAAQPMLFGNRISKLATLMRKTKARCNEFMLGNTLEDTIALIDLKVSDQKSNSANNYMRSLKAEETNKFLKIPKGAKWPKDKEGHPLAHSELLARRYDTPESTMLDEVKEEHDGLGQGEGWQHAEVVHQPLFAESGSVSQQEGYHDQKPALNWLADVDLSTFGFASQHGAHRMDLTTPGSFTSPHGAFEDFLSRGAEVEGAHGSASQSPRGSQSFAPTHPAQMEPTASYFDSSRMSNSREGFDNFNVGYGQHLGQQVGMPPLPPHGFAPPFAGIGDISRDLQAWPYGAHSETQ